MKIFISVFIPMLFNGILAVPIHLDGIQDDKSSPDPRSPQLHPISPRLFQPSSSSSLLPSNHIPHDALGSPFPLESFEQLLWSELSPSASSRASSRQLERSPSASSRASSRQLERAPSASSRASSRQLERASSASSRASSRQLERASSASSRASSRERSTSQSASTSSSPLECPYCPRPRSYRTKQFRGLQGLTNHVKKSHPKKLREYFSHKRFDGYLQCDECPVKAPTNRALNVHVESHHTGQGKKRVADESPPSETCPYCARQFHRLGDLTRHVMNGHPEKLEEYFAHERFDGALQCEECVVKVSLKSTMSHHMASAHGGRQKKVANESSSEKCPYCSRPFRRLPDLIQHVSGSHPENLKEFFSHERFDGWPQCNGCDVKAKSGAALGKHESQVHKKRPRKYVKTGKYRKSAVIPSASRGSPRTIA